MPKKKNYNNQIEEGKSKAESTFNSAFSFLKKIFLGDSAKSGAISIAARKYVTYPMLIIFAAIIVCVCISTMFVPSNILFSNYEDLRSTQAKIRSALINRYDGEINADSSKVNSYIEKKYKCKNMINAVAGEPTYSRYVDAEDINDQLNSRDTRYLINLDNPDGGNTCYVEVNYENLNMFHLDTNRIAEGDKGTELSAQTDEKSDDNNPKITVDEIVYAYATAVDTVLQNYDTGEYSVKEGDLGAITPSAKYGIAASTVDNGGTVSMAGYYNYSAVLEHYINNDVRGLTTFINDDQALADYKEIMGLPGYSEHELGNTVSIQWTGDNAPETTIQAEVNESGEVTAKEYQISSACVSNPQYGGGGACSYSEYEALTNNSAYQKDDGNWYYSIGESSNDNLAQQTFRCGNAHSPGNEACFIDEKIQKTFEVAVDNGWVLRYPYGKENETGHKGQYWTFTYVGKEAAKAIYNNGNWLTLESYYGVSGGDYGNPDAVLDADYKPGNAGGTGDATATKVANKAHYVENGKEPAVVKCGSIELTQEACDAFKAFQTAMSNHGDEEKEDVSEDELNEELMDVPDENLFEESYEEDENGNVEISSGLTDAGKERLKKGGVGQKDTEKELLKNIKNIKGNLFYIENDSGVNEYKVRDLPANLYLHRILKDEDTSSCVLVDNPSTGSSYYEDPGCVKRTITGWEMVNTDYKFNMYVPLKIDLRGYRKDELNAAIEEAKEQMVDKGKCVYVDDDEAKKFFGEDEISNTCTAEEVEKLFWSNIAYYYNQTIAAFGGKCNKTYYTSDGVKIENVCDDGTEFSVDGDENKLCLYMRILQGLPTTKVKTTTAGAGLDAPEEIASIPENTVYPKGSSENADMFNMISTQIPYYYGGQCTDFVWWRFKLQYGLDTGGGNGRAVASNTAARYPDKFELVSINLDNYTQVDESYAGSIISQLFAHQPSGACKTQDSVGHVLFLEKVDTSSGEPIIWYSEGNYGASAYGAIRINMKQSLHDFLIARCNSIELCAPVNVS